MYNSAVVNKLINQIMNQSGKYDKEKLSELIMESFNLNTDGSVFVGESFGIRFSSSRTPNPGNTVMAFAKVKKYDYMPLFVCIVTPKENVMLMTNSTFIKKVSHSSKELTLSKIRGSINASDIEKIHDGIKNEPQNFERLFDLHSSYSFEDNLERIVQATHEIQPTGVKYNPTEKEIQCIINAPNRTIDFMETMDFTKVKQDLDNRTNAVRDEIAIIERCVNNVNLRGRLIEYFITSDDTSTKEEIIQQVVNNKPISLLYTGDSLGDWSLRAGEYSLEIDIKSKILTLSSNPKAYNIDKLLTFLSKPYSVYLIFLVAVNNGEITTELTSIYQKQLLDGTRIQQHWSGRNSRGEAQFDGNSLDLLISNPKRIIEVSRAREYMKQLIEEY